MANTTICHLIIVLNRFSKAKPLGLLHNISNESTLMRIGKVVSMCKLPKLPFLRNYLACGVLNKELWFAQPTFLTQD